MVTLLMHPAKLTIDTATSFSASIRVLFTESTSWCQRVKGDELKRFYKNFTSSCLIFSATSSAFFLRPSRTPFNAATSACGGNQVLRLSSWNSFYLREISLFQYFQKIFCWMFSLFRNVGAGLRGRVGRMFFRFCWLALSFVFWKHLCFWSIVSSWAASRFNGTRFCLSDVIISETKTEKHLLDSKIR